MSDKNNKKSTKQQKLEKKCKKTDGKTTKMSAQFDKPIQTNARRATITTPNSLSPPILCGDPKKFERSNSFFLKRKLSKFVNTFSESRDHLLPKIPDDDENANAIPYKFTRSRSMILLRRPNKRSVIEPPQLGKLTEEMERGEKPLQLTSPVQTLPEINAKDLPHTKKRSSSLITALKRTFSSSGDKKKVNTRWSASLVSLQEIDNMVSYNDLSFIDYDKFNSYERILEERISQQDLRRSSPHSDGSGGTFQIKVVRRVKQKQISAWPSMQMELCSKFDSTFERNLDEKKNLYRQSLDEKKLQHINDVQRDSFQWINSMEIFLRGESVPLDSTIVKVQRNESFKRKSCDAVLCCASEKSSENFGNTAENKKHKLKSKSLTHLDTLDSLIACHQRSSTASQKPRSEQLDTTCQQQHENQTIVQHQQLQHHSSTSSTNTCNKICCLGSTTTTAITAIGGASNSQSLSSIQSGLPSNPVTNSQGSVHKKKSSLMNRKKPLLTRSEVSSSEYFSVYFYTESGGQDEELIPATKGVTLSEALSDALKKRKLNFSQITISDNNFQSFTESGSPPYYTSSLDENTDVESLAGKLLIVTEKDLNKKTGTLQKAASFGSRTRPPRLLSSASTEETTESEQKAVPGKQLKQRWSGLFGIRNPQQNQLCELLNFYAKNGVPQKSSSLNFDHPNFDMALEYLDKVHKSWKDFVNCDGMLENDVKIQTAIWELVTTEVDYIHALQTVTDLFLACLEAIQEEKILTDVDQNKLFSNIRDICEANLKFWTLYIYPMVAHSISTHNPLCIDYFQPGFVTFATTFAPYKKYCAEQSTCQFYCKELNRNNALFTAYLAWCESQKMCNRLRLADILVRPMQRLTKYSLLLTAIRKHIVDENDTDIMDSMIHSVENFVYSVNTHLTTRQENERLKGIMARIESYDVVDSNNEHLDKLAKQYCTMVDLCSPMKGCANNQGRHLFMEGDLKLKDNLGKLDVHCFVLTDILLICKTIAKKGHGTLKVVRQPFMTDRLVVKHKDNTLYCVYLNEFQMVVTAFTLQCAEAKSWHDSITKAKHIYSRLKQGSNWDGYNFRYGGTGGSGTGDTLGVKKSPLNSSIGSRVSSLNNSHSGSVELNDSRNISVDFEKANSLSSDEGSMMSANNAMPPKPKTLLTSPHKLNTSSSNTLIVQPLNSLGQSLPNLNLHPSQSSNNTLLVPGTGSSHSGNLLSPSQRGISYPPPSPTRATLRRGFAFSSSIKNPPLVKTRNITSQSSINWHPTPVTPSTSPQPPSSPSLLQHQQQQQQISPGVIMTTGLQISNESDV